MDEISVLDYVKFKLNPKNWGKEILPEDTECGAGEAGGALKDVTPGVLARCSDTLQKFFMREKRLSFSPLMPLLTLAGTLFALAAQTMLEPTIIRTGRTPWIAALTYLLSALCFLFAFADGFSRPRSGENRETSHLSTVWGDIKYKHFSEIVRLNWLSCSLICALAAFLLFGGNRFTTLNCFFWFLSILFALAAFANLPEDQSVLAVCRDWLKMKFASLMDCLKDGLHLIRMQFSVWNLLCLAVFLLSAFFRFYQLNTVPLDMFSDHAEKLYDVMDVLDGKTPIFFTRNTGREAFQFYWTVLMIKLFGTGISFLSLKIGTALAGLFILPFVYKLGKMAGNRWVGLIAMLFCGVAYWPNVIGRVALRFAFYPMFTAPALYFLYKGLMRRDRGALIWSGLFLGAGLQGYSSMRIVPVLFVVIFLIWLFMEVPPSLRKNALYAFLTLILFAVLAFLPLMRVTIDMPEAVIYRSMTRIGEAESAFSSSPMVIFLSNFWKAVVMPFWSDGSTWVHSIVGRPALDHISASFYFIGILLILLRFIKRRKWEDLCLLLMVPILMLPSILSLAFPNENPCLNRTGAALIPIMLISAFGFCFCFEQILTLFRGHMLGTLLSSAAAVFLLINICGHNYDLVFVQYRSEYAQNAWNTTQVGSLIKGFADSIGSYEETYVIPNAHWVDTRLTGITAGDPRRDYALDKSLIATLPDTEKARMFIYRDSDSETRQILQQTFPGGYEELHFGPYSGKNFYTYTLLSTY